MQIIEKFTSYEGHRIICPSTDEIIWAPDFEEFNTEAFAFKGYWYFETLEDPQIRDPQLQKDWEVFYEHWKNDPNAQRISDALEQFFKEYNNPEWIVYYCEYYRTASCYYVVQADTIIEEDPEEGPEYRDKHNYIKNSRLSVIEFPEGATFIKDSACYSYSNLEEVFIPETVTSIGQAAFMFCWGLKKIKLPDSITHIGNKAFRECKALEQIELPNALTTIPDEMSSNCKSLKSIVIPDSVTHIGNNAFEGCEALTSITIPESVETIGDGAFKACGALEKVVVPEKLKYYAESTFNEATLQKIVYY